MERFLCCSWLAIECGSCVVPDLAGLLLLHEKVSTTINHDVAVMSFMLLSSNRRRTARAKRRVRYAILDRKNTEERRRMLPHDDYQQTSLMVSESETEEEILFQTKTGETGTKNGNGTVSPADVQIRTNHKLANGSAKTGAGADHSAGT